MFRANVDPALVNVTDSLFCIRTKGIVVIHTYLRNGCFSLNELERVIVIIVTMICILLVLWYFMEVTFVEIYQQSLYFLNCLPPDNVPQPLPALPQLPAVGNSYHFLGSLPTSSSYSRDFYRVNSISLIISFI